MKKYFGFVLLTFIFSANVFAQKLEVEVNYVTTGATATKPIIYYTPNTKLTWNDFNGKPDKNSEAAAITNAGIGFNMTFHSKDNVATLNIAVDCNFSKNDSWVKSGKKTDYILNHEQHHFDIAYLFAMQFIHDLKAAKYTVNDYSKTIEKIYYNTQAALLAMQNDYDAETKNSQLTDEQARWNKRIDAQVSAVSKQ